MEGSHDHSRRKAAAPQPLQPLQERLQLGLILLQDAISPLLRTALHDPPGVGGKSAVVVAEVEPAVVPVTVGRRELGWDVEELPVLVHLESAAAALIAYRVPIVPAGLVVSPVRKRWSHSSQWGAMPRYPSQTATKMAAYAMELGLKLWSSTP